VAPYFVFIQVNGGLISYFRQASAWAERDRAREPIVWPGLFDYPDGESDEAKAGSLVAKVRDNAEAWVYYTEILLPFFALFVLAVSRDGFRPDWPHAREKLAMVAVLGAALDAGFLRSPLEARLADPSVPLVILAAWLLVALPRLLISDASLQPAWLRVRVPLKAITALIGVLMVLLFVFLIKGDLYRRLDKASMTDRFGKPFERVGVIAKQLHMDWDLGLWAARPERPDLITLSLYINACTTPDDRVLVQSYLPQVLAIARRAFGGGHADLRPVDGPAAPQPIGPDHPARHRRLAAQLLPCLPDRDGLHRPGISSGWDAHVRRALRYHAVREKGPHAYWHVRAAWLAMFRVWEECGLGRRKQRKTARRDRCALCDRL
jgi:hypothetical protein